MSERSAQIVEAALELLADTPVDSLTTRQIAKHVGVSQPALFRHFRTRQQLLVGAVEHVTAAIGERVEAALAGPHDPLGRVRAVVEILVSQAARTPGVPRLLFHDAAKPASAELDVVLRRLAEMQLGLLAESVRAAQRAGQAPPDVDATASARLLVAAIQGVCLQAQLTGEPLDAERWSAWIFDAWASGLAAGHPRAAGGPAPRRAPSEPLVALDVRPTLAAGHDPLEQILGALAGLPRDGLLLVHAPFRPTPLLRVAEDRGFVATARALDGGLWQAALAGPDAPDIDALDDLEAPEPMERVLLASAKLAPGAAYIARVPRRPAPLLVRLGERGLECHVVTEPTGAALIHVRRPR
jgi:AcrR family transcriptional regulator